MSKVKYNKSKTYLLPLLTELIPIRLDFMNYLINTYIFDDMSKYKDCIGILHDFSFKNPEFTRYEHDLTDNELFVDFVDVGNQVLYIFKFPEEYMHEYEKFKQGKYSKFNLDAKELVLDFWGEIYTEQVAAVPFLLNIKQVLFKDKKLKQKLERQLSSRTHKVVLDDDAELSSIMEETDETFMLSNYINKEENESKNQEITPESSNS